MSLTGISLKLHPTASKLSFGYLNHLHVLKIRFDLIRILGPDRFVALLLSVVCGEGGTARRRSLGRNLRQCVVWLDVFFAHYSVLKGNQAKYKQGTLKSEM